MPLLPALQEVGLPKGARGLELAVDYFNLFEAKHGKLILEFPVSNFRVPSL
jgi:hypothetical protein